MTTLTIAPTITCEMTEKQKMTIAKLERRIKDRLLWGYADDRGTQYEIKEYIIKPLYSDEDKALRVFRNTDDIVVYVTVGMKGDEGTMAEIICRDHIHMFIGKNGGCVAYLKRKNYDKTFKTTRVTGFDKASRWQ